MVKKKAAAKKRSKKKTAAKKKVNRRPGRAKDLTKAEQPNDFHKSPFAKLRSETNQSPESRTRLIASLEERLGKSVFTFFKPFRSHEEQIDDDDAEIVIDAPDGGNVEGTTVTGRTDSKGLARFRIRIPIGADYTFIVYVQAGDALTELSIAIATEG